MVKIAEEAAELLKKRGVDVTLVNMRFVKPFDRELLRELAKDHELFVTMEENVENGGFGQQVLDFAEQERLPVHISIAAVPDCFVRHGSVEGQRKRLGLDAESIARRVQEELGMSVMAEQEKAGGESPAANKEEKAEPAGEDQQEEAGQED